MVRKLDCRQLGNYFFGGSSRRIVSVYAVIRTRTASHAVKLNRFNHMPLTVGDKLGPYETSHLSGKAAWGEVYRPRRTPAARCRDQGQQRSVYRALHASRIAYTGRAEGGLTQWYTRSLDQLGSTLLPDTTLLECRRSTRARRLPSPS